MSDRDKIKALLEERGAEGVTTFEIRHKGLSGNPSQRIRELTDAGLKIDSEPYVREYDGRRGSRYILRPEGSLF
jgi:hypothetical protein